MPTLNEYFRTEANDFLNALERSLQRTPGPDAAELHRAVRGLRGTAQMARDERVVAVVSAFESVTRSMAGNALAWTEQVATRARDTIVDLRALLEGIEDEEQLDARVAGAAARWNQQAAGAAASASPTPTAAGAATADNGTREFREFAAREAAAIADALDYGIQALQSDPMDREPLRTVLRRQRALLGSARLEEIPVVADILRAIEDLTRVIARLDVGVKQEWLDIYRVARDALQTTIAPLLRDELPTPSNSVSRLRHMRAELLERYGSGDDDAPPPDQAFAMASTQRAAPAAATDDVLGPGTAGSAGKPDGDVMELGTDSIVAEPDGDVMELGTDSIIDDGGEILELGADSIVGEPGGDVLELGMDSIVDDPTTDAAARAAVASGGPAVTGRIDPREDALRRALELREVIARAAGHDPQARDAVEELFYLIRSALG